MVNIKHHAIHVGLVLVIGFLLYPAFKKSSRKKVVWYDWILLRSVRDHAYLCIRPLSCIHLHRLPG